MADEGTSVDRRNFLSSALMWTGVAVGYGIGAFHFLRYLVPLGEKVKMRELFVGPVDQLQPDESMTIRTPSGDTYIMTRTAKALESESFQVLSDICPHLGCRVHWQPRENRFFCPCHNGIFDKEGIATGGPPAEARQRLTRLETRIRGRSVFVLIKES